MKKNFAAFEAAALKQSFLKVPAAEAVFLLLLVFFRFMTLSLTLLKKIFNNTLNELLISEGFWRILSAPSYRRDSWLGQRVGTLHLLQPTVWTVSLYAENVIGIQYNQLRCCSAAFDILQRLRFSKPRKVVWASIFLNLCHRVISTSTALRWAGHASRRQEF